MDDDYWKHHIFTNHTTRRKEGTLKKYSHSTNVIRNTHADQIQNGQVTMAM